MRRLLGKIVHLLAVLLVASVAVETVRYGWAVRQVRQAWEAPTPSAVHDLGTTTTLRILPLVDETAGRADLIAEHGVSYLISTDHQTILMDFGWNQTDTDPSPLQHNLQQLGVNQADVDLFFISHPHPDHLGRSSLRTRSRRTRAAAGRPPVAAPE